MNKPLPRVDIKTDRFHMRGLNASDATERVVDWLADPDVAYPLNIKPRRLPIDVLKREFSAGNGVTRFIIGIFVRESGKMIGYYKLDRDARHKVVTFNVCIGDKEWWGKGTVLETRAALLTHLFEERDVDKCVGRPLARNFPAIFNYQKQGWAREGTMRGQLIGAEDDSRVDQFQFGMLAEDWAKLKEEGRA